MYKLLILGLGIFMVCFSVSSSFASGNLSACKTQRTKSFVGQSESSRPAGAAK